MGKGKRKGRRFPKKEAISFHLVHRSQRDPLAADESAAQMVLVPNEWTAKKLERARRMREANAALDAAVMTQAEFAEFRPGDGQGGYEYEYEYYSDDDDGGEGTSGGRKAKAAGAGAGAVVPKTVDGRAALDKIHADADADVDGSVVDNYAYSAYFGHSVGGDVYDYSQHLRPFGRDGTFVPAGHGRAPPVADVTVFKPTVELTESKIDELTGLPAAVLASEFEEDVGLLNLAAPVPEGFRTDLPLDVLMALEDEDEFEELQDDFIAVAQSEEPVGDGDGFDETEWALEYARVMDPARYEKVMMSRSEMGGGMGGFGSDDGMGGSDAGIAYGGFGRGLASDSGSTASKYVSVVPVYGTPYSVASTVSRPRAGMLEIEDERLEVMMETEYEVDQIGELEQDVETQGDLPLDFFDSIIADVLEGKILRRHYKKEILLEPIANDDELRARILAVAAAQDEADKRAAAEADAAGIDPIERAIGYKPRPKPVEDDVVSVLSYNSNSTNHPRKINVRRVARPDASKIITLTPEGIPLAPGAAAAADDNGDDGGDDGDDADDDDEYEVFVLEGAKRPKKETPEEKRARKKRVKEAKRLARERKKANRAVFKQEKARIDRELLPHDGTKPGRSTIRY